VDKKQDFALKYQIKVLMSLVYSPQKSFIQQLTVFLSIVHHL